MKKLFMLFVSFLALSAACWAQDEELDETFVFVDEQGNVLPDGTVITVSAINGEGQMVVPVKVRNVQGDKAAVSMYETIDALPNGEWQTCAFGNCMMLNATGYSSKSITNGSDDTDIQTEWIPTPGKYASWSATLQIHVFNIITQSKFGITTEAAGSEVIGYGPTVTLNFVYNENSASIDNVQFESEARDYYNVRGQRLDGPRKGLNIIRLANGKTVKRVL